MRPLFRQSQAITLIASLATAGSLLASAPDMPEITEEGLHKLKDTNLGLVYADPDADLSTYDRVHLLEASVAFKKNWQRDQNRSYAFKVKASDMERMKSGLAELFHDVFSEELAEGGYELTEETADDVLLIRPAIINLDVTAPDVQSATRSYQYAESAGEMTLYVELYDAVTGALLAKAMDRKRDRDRGYFQWQSRVTNTSAAKRILKSWAETLREALDEAHVVTTKD